MSCSCPRRINGSAGSRIRVLLGASGSDYLYYLDEDNGDHEWQTRDWTVEDGGPPSELCRQMNAMIKKDRHITDAAFGLSGEWYVAGEKRDGSGHHWWCGGTDASAAIKGSHRTKNKVAFRPNGGWVVLNGSNGYQTALLSNDLTSRMNRIHDNGKSIGFVRFEPCMYGGGYFISDDEGTEWQGLGCPLDEELKNGGNDPILDLSIARDGTWVVVRPNRFSASTGVSSELTRRLAQFYKEHQERQSRRTREIKLFYQREREAEERRKAAEEREAEEQRREQERVAQAEREAEALRQAAERARREKEELMGRLKRKSDEADCFRQIQAKRLKTMVRVTAVGFS
ncbi:hypothetical protein ACHAWF_013705 [Thalassiosira exigua]